MKVIGGAESTTTLSFWENSGKVTIWNTSGILLLSQKESQQCEECVDWTTAVLCAMTLFIAFIPESARPAKMITTTACTLTSSPWFCWVLLFLQISSHRLQWSSFLCSFVACYCSCNCWAVISWAVFCLSKGLPQMSLQALLSPGLGLVASCCRRCSLWMLITNLSCRFSDSWSSDQSHVVANFLSSAI